MENINCDHCGGTKTKLIASSTDKIHKTTNEIFKIVQCENCGLQYTNPRPDTVEIKKYYSSEYNFYQNNFILKQILISILSKLVNSRLVFLFNLVPYFSSKLKKYIKPNIEDPVLKYANKRKNLLDIGCGNGISSHFWGYKGAINYYKNRFNVVGIEVSEQARLVSTNNGLKVFPNLISLNTNFKFDIIRMNWSFEHVHSPSQYFKFAYEKLNTKGIFIITVPNYDGLLYKYDKDLVELPIHLYHFTKKDLENFAQKYKFKVKEITTFSYPEMYNLASTNDRGLNEIFSSSSLLETYYIQKHLSVLDKFGYGNDIICILEK